MIIEKFLLNHAVKFNCKRHRKINQVTIVCDKSAITPNDQKLYLATFEFMRGEYGQMFEKLFYAQNEKNSKKQIHKFLNDYYGEANTSKVEGNAYHYLDGEVSVIQHRWEETTGFVNKLLGKGVLDFILSERKSGWKPDLLLI